MTTFEILILDEHNNIIYHEYHTGRSREEAECIAVKLRRQHAGYYWKVIRL